MQPKAVFQALMEGDFLDHKRATIIWERCRDREILVFEDERSGVIYLDPSHTGNPPDYYKTKNVPSGIKPRNDMDVADTDRRDQLLKPIIANKRWLDFGCGAGFQLRKSHEYAYDLLGFELNANNLQSLKADGHTVTDSPKEIIKFRPEIISLFHVLEHLDDPISHLEFLQKSSAPGARLVVEIPHARDWLLHHGPSSFKDFTFWSEHLVLHTKESLRYILEEGGWLVDEIINVQRYPLWNHLAWFELNKPTGIGRSALDESSRQLANAYQAFLAARNQTDTLVALARSRP